MSQPDLLQSLIGYEPIIDRKRKVTALRVRLSSAAGEPQQLSTLYRELSEGWPDGSHAVLVSAPDAVFDDSLAEVKSNPNVWLEIPADTTAEPRVQTILGELSRKGLPLVLRGRTSLPLPPALLSAFRMSIIHVDEDRRLRCKERVTPAGFKRSIGYAQDGVKSIELMERCFDSGAAAVLGWPMDDAITYRERPSSAPDYFAIMQLITMADRGEDPPKMEAVIRRDPAIAYRLLRYINSVGFGLTVEVQSFRHAIMMLGYQKLKRWLALLLATSSKDANMRPVMLASFRRGLLLEALLDEAADDAARDEMFILGVFSLLDKLMKKPFDELFGNLAVPESVHDTLVHRTGQYVPYLRIVESIEQGPDPKLPDALDNCLMTLEGCNRAVLRMLQAPELHQA